MRSLVFAVPGFERFVAAFAERSWEEGRCTIARFANGELHISRLTPPAGRDCLVIGSTAPPDERLLAILLLCHTLRKEGAGEIAALLPYLGYARQDRDEAGKSLGASWIGQMLKAAGVDRAFAADVHSPLVAPLFPMPLRSISPAALFADALATLRLEEPTIVAPDEGARERCEAVRAAAGIRRPVAWFEKHRAAGGIRHLELHGDVTQTVVIVDDILDTGATLVSAAERLGEAGARMAVVMVTHGLFTGTAWQRLWMSSVDHVYCTDTVSDVVPASPRISVLAIGTLLARALSAERAGAVAGREHG